MAYASTIVLKNAAAANVTYVRLTSDTSKVSYADQAGSLAQPALLVIGHQMSSSPSGVDRHLVKLTKTMLDANNSPKTFVLNCSLSVPRTGVTRTEVNDAIAGLKEFLVTANVDALLRGEL